MTASLRRAGVVTATVVVVLLTALRPATADNIRDEQWYLAALGIAEAQKLGQGEGVVVGLADTGVDVTHAELAGAVLPGKGFGEGNDSEGKIDWIGHGTAMAGLIAGRGLPGGGGVLGVAPKSMILPLQTLRSEDGHGVPAFLAAGIDWAVDHGARVICIAGGTGEDATVRESVERAMRSDVVIVAAAGNTPDQTAVAFPASLPGVLAVGGTDRGGNHASISATGPQLVIAAPAVDVVSTKPSGKYAVSSGTSDAAALVSGVVALVRAKYPSLSGPEVVHRITATATDKGRPGRDDEYGFGVVNPLAALTADLPPPQPSSSASAGAPPVPASASAEGGGTGGKPVKAAVVAAGGVALVLLAGLVLWRAARVRR
ncbi:type VII secretion-associated serine protease mycosin [Dactylosporangium darangshiense]|uniref:Type VII secretion-associated serine protease mycosin n=1 Tax=Dactylosporangium darangshiense TaxID=579108 RepID=A0ABP8D2W7_9ACTN